MRESDFHDWLRRAVPAAAGAKVGIGDDAAVLEVDGPIVWASDLLVEGVHFRKAEIKPQLIGAKAVNRCLSDMAAMGASPRWLLVSAAVPERTAEEDLCGIVTGMIRAAERFGAGIVGGDTSRTTGPLVLDVSVIGRTEGPAPVLRSGAAPGDRILVTGRLGGSIRGKHLSFLPRVEEGLFLNRWYPPTSMIDISDGFCLDLTRILDASNRGARVEGDRIPLDPAAQALAEETKKTPLAHGLSDGEDFELLFTLPPEQANRLEADPRRGFPVTAVGEILEDPMERVILVQGKISSLGKEGYDHWF